MTFKELNIIEPVLEALIKEGYDTPTPIQEQAIPFLLNGRDVLGCAQTGTGKTAAFSIPIIQKLVSDKLNSNSKKDKTKIKALILTPTRELASQIGDSFSKYGAFTSLKHTVVFGGVSQKAQTNALKKGVDILVATPGRLLDLAGQGYINFSNIDFFVLDEADRMLDMGFINDIEKIIKKIPAQRQTLLFSATMPTQITSLAESLLDNPVRVEVTPVSSTVDTIDQYLYFAKKADKGSLLMDILNDKFVESALIFSRTKHGADKLSKNLSNAGINADSIHGNKSQSAREKSLSNFKKKKTRVLVATDIAARGIDISQISHVINYDLPEDPETYVHRIGRTGRAGYDGTALSFCDVSEIGLLKSIQKLIGREIPVISEHEYNCEECAVKMTRLRKSIASPKSAKRDVENGGNSDQGKKYSGSKGRKGKKARGQFWQKGKRKSA
ncbi:MAG: DEAD/DEAH box helicase [Bacteroidia bacterium]|jgi:ATP-dependent RNA helicase RhlE|nr:DEAD/DEAH box helicase [Bacteroidales bacterium]MDD3299360.1 DEAD/DEAH box helicase [Bacteroidales bacterium]MDD3843812.1 DEAD/DEAH box helicase [Bacteroidales bacterium]MDD4618252.1 DEAD/DEAH box helicase [Bacteroidales bacterium]NCC45675.1 DEAD/DEAH box helicase [Bacteroidia bacterium]